MKCTSNKEQRAYMLAKANLRALEEREAEMEKSYIVANGIINSDGTIPDRICCIEDEKTFDRANEETAAASEKSGLWPEILQARESLRAAEDALIAYGIRIAPAGIRVTLERGAKENFTIREKIIDLVYRLDVSTVR